MHNEEKKNLKCISSIIQVEDAVDQKTRLTHSFVLFSISINSHLEFSNTNKYKSQLPNKQYLIIPPPGKPKKA